MGRGRGSGILDTHLLLGVAAVEGGALSRLLADGDLAIDYRGQHLCCFESVVPLM